MVEIKEIDYGIACRIGDVIYLNKDLINYPSLYAAILEHEKSHSSGFTFKDIKLDIHNPNLKGLKGQYYRFVLTHPKSLIEFLPAWKYDNHLVWNPLVLGLYGLIYIIFGVIWMLI
jgi:hypothetical protein